MTQEQLTAFFTQFQGHANLQKKLKLAGDPNAVASIENDPGFNLHQDASQVQLAHADLKEVFGGNFFDNYLEGTRELQQGLDNWWYKVFGTEY